MKKREPKLPAPNRLHSVELQGHRTDVPAMDISNDSKSLLATASNGTLKRYGISRLQCISRTFDLWLRIVLQVLARWLLNCGRHKKW